MERSVEPVQPQVRILPPKRDRRRGRRFVIDGEVQPVDTPREEDESSEQAAERPVGHPADDESGARLDVTT